MKRKKIKELLARLGTNAAELAEQGLDALIEKLEGKSHTLDARFERESKVLSRTNKGFNLTGKSISSKLSEQGCLVVGGTGSGKSSVSVFRSILTVDGSQFNNDPSKELISSTGGSLQEDGVDVIPIDVARPNGIYFNPYKRCVTRAELNKLSTQLMHAASGRKDFWSQSGIQLLTIIGRGVKQMPEEYQNPYNAYNLLDQMASEERRKDVSKFMAIADETDPGLFDNYEGLILGSGEEALPGIIASARTAIQQYSLDENLAIFTSKDNLGDFSQWRRKRTAVFVHSSTTRGDYYSGIVSVLASQYADAFFIDLADNEKDLPVFFHLDEIPLLKGLDNLDSIAANLRKYNPGGGLMLVCQDTKQLESNYGREKAQTILSNLRTKLYLSTSLETAEKLSRELGKYEYTDPKTKHKKQRPLLTPDEIMQLENKGLITIQGKRPVLAGLTPYYKVRAMVKRTEIPFKEPVTRRPELPKLFDLKAYVKEWESQIGQISNTDFKVEKKQTKKISITPKENKT